MYRIVIVIKNKKVAMLCLRISFYSLTSRPILGEKKLVNYSVPICGTLF
jgi:hypothetical protein